MHDSSLPSPTHLKDIIPEGRHHRLFLYTIRRMAISGVNDAHAANALLGSFGQSYRRPLVLMRTMLLEIARVSQRKITLAPCCCARVTRDEAMLIEIMQLVATDTQLAHVLLTKLLGCAQPLGVLTCAQAVAAAFSDLGRPV